MCIMLLSNNRPRKWFPYKKLVSIFSKWGRLLIYNKENLNQCSQATPVKDGNFDFNDTMTSLSEKLSSSIIESASENENQNPASSDNKTLPDSLIKPKGKRRCIQLLRAEEHFEEEPSERKLDTVETGRDNEEDDTKKI